MIGSVRKDSPTVQPLSKKMKAKSARCACVCSGPYALSFGLSQVCFTSADSIMLLQLTQTGTSTNRSTESLAIREINTISNNITSLLSKMRRICITTNTILIACTLTQLMTAAKFLTTILTLQLLVMHTLTHISVYKMNAAQMSSAMQGARTGRAYG